ncbi:flagellar biosynthesis protein FlhF [Paraburkholderia domus]|uniref:Flagellar biosynthesis protein FlhF n=1 Tax=Paraburkholderia domus TaxID=2793075 RepID=A0A9N8QTQ6_9BURK|nr:flagellar biosynthesis protein FlhF [Paraburkholderia domus]MBK5119746.1 flagellar biosynthesis protein FlhF [Burkholderia sp. R-69980]MBK5164011.1 flagellar biosynthesis protein FlhF [Burkholderia sp. R-70211]MBK5178831.1 flagellar biosynthesis protein FlhF [Burkholderia sp. R-69749]MCI0148546.1 flagellar biosynthesis protein FlhF [Paraburkholderia sediminicola]CAE6777657.1 Signal recognition particle receptor FtsY [Paraburkholderia domus]
MNIRKFVGATSRDALRLVREALGPDAVVLSNQTMDDGSVEIVALADSDLAAITPKAPRGRAGAPLAAPMNAMAGQQPARANPTMQANPYASGMPDVFSSVFGASPEAGAENMTSNAAGAASGSAAKSAVPAAPKAALPNASKAALATPAAASPSQPISIEQPSARAAATRLTDDIRADLLKAAGMPAAPATPAVDAPRTMAESNPWLIDHARRIAAEQQEQGAYSARPAAMTPAAAMAKGLGAAVEPTAQPAVPPVTDTPEWAREAAQVAARRAAQKVAPPLPTGDDARTPASVAEAIKARMEQVVNDTVMSELSSMRGMMEEHFAGLLWGDRQRRSPTRAALTKHLFAAGFSAQLVQMMVDNLPDDVDNMEGGMAWVRSVLESNLPVMEDEDALMERGGVFALMGPTGVGKTTTTAKLAARCVMRFGASKVALLTTDSYRIGGHEQLRIFGKILGVSVHAVKDGADLQLALSELRNKHIVLIDTIGMSQRDRLVSDQIAMLCRAGLPVQRLLLLNATSHGDTLNEVVQAYQRAPDQQPLAGCILTKLDEATNLGGVLDTVIRYKLPVHYVSTGQKVPENLYVATKKFLIKSTFCIPRDNSPFVPHDDDIPGLLSALSARSTAELHEVRFG